MDYMISSDDLKNLIGEDLRIIKFQDLKNYSSLYQLLPKVKDYVVIFFTDDKKNNINIGHWTCLLRYKNKFEFFDSYGLAEENELKFIPKEKRIEYGEDIDYLKIMLSKVKNTHNKYDYQQWDDNVTTCGRWVALRIILFKICCITLEQFHDTIMRTYSKMKFKNLDLLSVYFTE